MAVTHGVTCLFLSHGGRNPRLNAREEVGSPHLPPISRLSSREEVGFPHLHPKTQKLPAFCRAGRAGRKSWSSQHVPPSRPEPKATVHKCSMLLNAAHSCTMRARCTKPNILWIQGACARALVAVTHGVTCLFLSHGGRNPRLNAREEVGSPHLPPSTPELTSIQNKVVTRDSPTRVLNKTRSMPSFMSHSHRRTPRDER